MKTLDVYIRVSQVRGREGQSFQSPMEQQKASLRALKEKGWKCGEVNTKDLDKSGGTANRPGFQRLLNRIKTKQVDGVVVIRADRFARSVVVGAECIEAIQGAGGIFLSATENIDYTSASGRFQANVLFSMAQYQRESAKEGWETARKNAVQDFGVHPVAPFGYRKLNEYVDDRGRKRGKGPLVIVLHEAEAVIFIFERRAAGDSWAAIASALREQGVKPRRGDGWSTSSLRKIVKSKTYLGWAQHGSQNVNKGGHEAIVTEDLWERANWSRSSRPVRNGNMAGLVSGVVRCACCGYAMKPDRQMSHGNPRMVYRCKGRNARPCTERSTILRDPVDEYVVDEFFKRYSPAVREVGKDSDATKIKTELAKARREFEAYRDDVGLRDALGQEMWAPGLKARAETVKTLERKLRETEVVVNAEELRGQWANMTFDQRRRVLRRGIEAVYVKRLRGGSVPERVSIAWANQNDDTGVAGVSGDEVAVGV